MQHSPCPHLINQLYYATLSIIKELSVFVDCCTPWLFG